jgi:hypothetical protein
LLLFRAVTGLDRRLVQQGYIVGMCRAVSAHRDASRTPHKYTNVAIPNVIASKTFDNGTICSSDQSVIFDDLIVADNALQLFEEQGAHLCTTLTVRGQRALRETAAPPIRKGETPRTRPSSGERQGFSLPRKALFCFFRKFSRGAGGVSGAKDEPEW